MAAVNYTSSRFSAEDDNGRPLTGGRLFTYQNGTTTPAVTYQDEAGTVPNTNPIILNARGEAVVYVQDSQTYTFVLQNRFGSLIWSQNGITGAATSTSFLGFIAQLLAGAGSSLVGFIQSGVGAVVQTVQDAIRSIEISPKSFGAKGDGTTDDTAALKRSIAASSLSGVKLNLRGGTWRITEPVDFTGVRCISADYYSNILVARTGTIDADSYAVTIGTPGASGVGRAFGTTVEGELAVKCVSRSVPQCGVYLKGSWLNIGHVHAEDFNGTGINAASVWDSTATRLRTERCGNSSKYALTVSPNGDTSNCLNITSIQCEDSHHRGLYIDCIRSVIQNIHSEGTYITVLNDGTPALPGGKTYTNHVLILGNCEVQQSYIEARPAGTAVPGGGTTISGDLAMTVFAESSQVSTMQMNGDLVVVGGVSGTFNTLTCDRFYQRGPASRTITKNLDCQYASAEAFCTFDNPRNIGTFDPGFNAQNISTFGGSVGTVDFSQSIIGGIDFTAVIIGTVLRTGEPAADRAATSFSDCEITTYTGGFTNRATVSHGYIKNVALVSQARVSFDGVEGNTFGLANPGDVVGYITNNCRFLTATWSVPAMAWPNGTRTNRVGYAASAGMDHVNRAGSNEPPVWQALTTSPA